MELPKAEETPAGNYFNRQASFTAYFFFGTLIVSTVVVLGRRFASFTGMNSPVLASRPIRRVAIDRSSFDRFPIIGALTVRQRLNMLAQPTRREGVDRWSQNASRSSTPASVFRFDLCI